MDDFDDSSPAADDPAAVAETLQRHREADADPESVGAIQPVVEAVAGWRDPETVPPDAWLAALELTPDALYLRTDEAVIRHRPAVTGDRSEPEPFRMVGLDAGTPAVSAESTRTTREDGSSGPADWAASAGGDAPAEPIDRETAAALLAGETVRIGVVDGLPVEIRSRFRPLE